MWHDASAEDKEYITKYIQTLHNKIQIIRVHTGTIYRYWRTSYQHAAEIRQYHQNTQIKLLQWNGKYTSYEIPYTYCTRTTTRKQQKQDNSGKKKWAHSVSVSTQHNTVSSHTTQSMVLTCFGGASRTRSSRPQLWVRIQFAHRETLESQQVTTTVWSHITEWPLSVFSKEFIYNFSPSTNSQFILSTIKL